MEDFDVAVIGAGIVGASCAYQLTDAGLRCVVLEREVSAAMGSTSKSTAVIRAQYYYPCNIALSLASLEELRHFKDRFGVDSGYRPVGYLYLIPPDMWDERMRAVELQRSLGVPVEVLTTDEARSRFVEFQPSGITGAQMVNYHWAGRPFVTEPGVMSLARRSLPSRWSRQTV